MKQENTSKKQQKTKMVKVLCLHCGRYHLANSAEDVEKISAWCAEQERISIQAEEIEFFDRWL